MKPALNRLLGLCLTASSSLAIWTAPVSASEIIYYPVNPSFGGNPLNGAYLLNSALATNKHTDPALDDKSSIDSTKQTPLQAFQESLERAVLSRLTSAATSNLFDPVTGKLVPGTVETGNFIITITDSGSGLLAITTLDKTTGTSTTFEVSQ
jgi:curli production assembly/transport component CsgF